MSCMISSLLAIALLYTFPFFDISLFFVRRRCLPLSSRQICINLAPKLMCVFVIKKTYPKDHKDIGLLRLRSFTIGKQILDNDITSPDFKDKLTTIFKNMEPLVGYYSPGSWQLGRAHGIWSLGGPSLAGGVLLGRCHIQLSKLLT